MNIHEWAERLQTTVAGFARLAGISRATANSWRADPDKSYSAIPRPQTLLDMAASLEVHGEEARQVAQELREAAGEPVDAVDLRNPTVTPVRLAFHPRPDKFRIAHSPPAAVDKAKRRNSKRIKKPATEV